MTSAVPIDGTTATLSNHQSLINEVDGLRAEACQKAAPEKRSKLGQYPTPLKIAGFMASLFGPATSSVRLLDPGAGVGSLSTAYVARLCNNLPRPGKLEVTAFEIDEELMPSLGLSLAKCGQACEQVGIGFDAHLQQEDFIAAGVDALEKGLFKFGGQTFNRIILNPPYKKINTDSQHRRLLRRVGIETTNLYAAFLGLSVLLLEPGGEMTAITPRSFCNGPYFKSFRRMFLSEMSIQRIHIFQSRNKAFSEADVLQENVIFHAVKDKQRVGKVIVSSSDGPDDAPVVREVAHEDLVNPRDPQQFIHIISNNDSGAASAFMGRLECSLQDLGISVSTGRVVDFRSQKWLRANPGDDTVPLIYPAHFEEGWVRWPRPNRKKANAFRRDAHSSQWLVEGGVYVLTKRFSAKEEKRRIVAAVFDTAHVPCEWVGFENHLNYFHANGRSLPISFAKGLTLFLNSGIVDSYFRQFSGHTQVNATDLRNLKYPSRQILEELGDTVAQVFPSQQKIDELFEKRLRT